MKVYCHYDNLKVSRDATAECIRSSYRALAARYHPDRNPGDPEAERIMKLLNKAYEVLSDSSRRRNHDEWIRDVERDAQTTGSSWNQTHPHPNPVCPVDSDDDNFVSRGFALDNELPGQFMRAQQTWAKRHF
jgi:curved DNA-binding protein CbpA